MALGEQLFFAVTCVAALGCGLVAGIFFSFSSFVMKALFRLPAEQGIAAMQSINIVVLNPWFMTAFFGTAVVCIVTLVLSLGRLPDPRAVFMLAGSVLYLAGCIMVTIVCNVPRNNSLAAIAPTDAKSAKLWDGYVSGWTAWNHVRTIASLAAAALFTVALGF